MTTTTMDNLPGNSIGPMVPEGWHTTADAAKLCGRSYDTLRQWRKGPRPVFKPSGRMKAGGLTIYLYSDADIEAMKVIAKERDQHPGGKGKRRRSS